MSDHTAARQAIQTEIAPTLDSNLTLFQDDCGAYQDDRRSADCCRSLGEPGVNETVYCAAPHNPKPPQLCTDPTLLAKCCTSGETPSSSTCTSVDNPAVANFTDFRNRCEAGKTTYCCGFSETFSELRNCVNPDPAVPPLCVAGEPTCCDPNASLNDDTESRCYPLSNVYDLNKWQADCKYDPSNEEAANYTAGNCCDENDSDGYTCYNTAFVLPGAPDPDPPVEPPVPQTPVCPTGRTQFCCPIVLGAVGTLCKQLNPLQTNADAFATACDKSPGLIGSKARCCTTTTALLGGLLAVDCEAVKK
ncbi:hypothetical protein CLAFUW4_07525 [Fulvia fulva]|uniref:Uncharacterized protein n=1 Tax=Passalora fulva TaxID=5499 RepID=A0A9Q8PAJ5_PASFU|nr:uncharacterized protein CLAFUR5_07655 [Fulvia fulva]KAK4621345.1 hypothetical protein CLAFUR4_07531 [Fulvia fulva]KAK4622932.1 hypothetical protein CLAFUR0_07530 [Fulvia fulva]UJO18885.1 hypothetical protein CLAFUR5_07655 [Fulvia fulva]WPV16586.1 hypothetical protein CLAFUW4_07525 [Fulvia fulva]WPV31103.1 hypothetical protein CLAFUW7_07527 [Fulvia fulva]